MSIWLAGLLAALIMVGGLVVLLLGAAGIVWLMAASVPTLKKILEVLFKVVVAICALGTLVGLWYIALSWLMGWSL